MTSPFENIQKSAEFQEELFVSEIQSYLASLLDREGMNRADLARALGVSRARITQIFSDDCPNLTVRTLARLFFTLREEVTVCSREIAEQRPKVQIDFGSDVEHVFNAWVQGAGQSGQMDSSVRDVLKDVLEQRRHGAVDKISRGSKSIKAGARDWASYSENVVSLDERRRANG